MRPDGVPIRTLLWRTFTPALVVVAVALGALVYTRLYDTILDGFSRKLVAVSSLTAALIDPVDHDTLIAAARHGEAPQVETTPAYVRNVAPLRRIRRQLGLTYLYSQVVGGSKSVFYVLDGTEGGDHSTLGAEDDLPATTTAGLRAAQAHGTVFVSPIEFQEQWGLLKTAAAPVRGADGRITATAGADVNIGVIQVATQNAVFASALIGVASLIASALVTLMVMRWVAQPIMGLKADALRIAAGDRAPPTPMPAPREVARLREALGDLAGHLVGVMRTTRAAALAQDRERNRDLLAGLLAEEPRVVRLVEGPDRLALWVGPDGEGPEARLQRRAMRQLAERIAANPDLAAAWTELAAPGGLLLVDRQAGEVRTMGREAVGLLLDAEAVRLAPGEARPLAAGQRLAVAVAYGQIPVDWRASA